MPTCDVNVDWHSMHTSSYVIMYEPNDARLWICMLKQCMYDCFVLGTS